MHLCLHNSKNSCKFAVEIGNNNSIIGYNAAIRHSQKPSLQGNYKHMENNLFKTWLIFITQIIKKQQEIAAIRGENYNLFKVIHMTSNETSVHSAFIADLLNPKGLHGMGCEFLRLFVDTINTHGITFDIEDSEVKIEEVIGQKNLEDTSGGRLDIIIKNKKGQAIIIENKINAKDQEAQMARYLNYANTKHKDKFLLLYLSLDGQVHDVDYTTKGVAKIDEDFYTMSYREDILDWLIKCRQLAVDKPLLREGITHYINLVKYLTHTNMDAQAQKEMTDIILKDPAYIKNLNEYANAITSSMQALTNKFWQELYVKMQLLAHENLRLVEIKDKDNQDVSIVKNPSAELVKGSASKFRIKSLRPKDRNCKFGLAYPIAEKNGQLLIAGIIIHSAVTFRVYTEDSKGYIPYSEVNRDFKRIREMFGDRAFPDKGWDENFYICVKRPLNSVKWDFATMNDSVLENLSDMDKCVESILSEFLLYINSLKEILKEK